MRILIALVLTAFGLNSAHADTLAEIAQFAQSICGDIPEGSMTRTNIQGKVEANAGAIAKILSGGVDVDASRSSEIYRGIPFEKLPPNIPTVSMCKSELVKLLISQRSAAPAPVVAQYTVCSGEYERACQQHDAYLYCYSDVQAWANQRCASARVVRLNSYGGNKCGYSMDRVFCTDPR
ncbi:MAG TPA: hypothetical protein VMT72_04325 [Pseudolabrys sp.]|nr:hypothetical protein [Pseudolabrys sp.]